MNLFLILSHPNLLNQPNHTGPLKSPQKRPRKGPRAAPAIGGVEEDDGPVGPKKKRRRMRCADEHPIATFSSEYLGNARVLTVSKETGPLDEDLMVLRTASGDGEETGMIALDPELFGELTEFPRYLARGVWGTRRRVEGVILQPKLPPGMSEPAHSVR